MLGADQYNPKGREKEGLDATIMVARHDSLYVRVYSFVVHCGISIPSSLSQLIGSTLALGYMRAGVFPDIFILGSTEFT